MKDDILLYFNYRLVRSLSHNSYYLNGIPCEQNWWYFYCIWYHLGAQMRITALKPRDVQIFQWSIYHHWNDAWTRVHGIIHINCDVLRSPVSFFLSLVFLCFLFISLLAECSIPTSRNSFYSVSSRCLQSRPLFSQRMFPQEHSLVLPKPSTTFFHFPFPLSYFPQWVHINLSVPSYLSPR